MGRQNILRHIINALEETNQYFQNVDDDYSGLDESYISNKELGKAKTYLAEADFVVNYFDRIRTSIHREDDFNELMTTFRKPSIIRKLEEAKRFFELCNEKWQKACNSSEEAFKSYSV